MADNSAMETKDSMDEKIGLDGFCPVCIIAKQKWEKGDPNITSTYDGVTYLFPGESIKAMFEAGPEKFVPVLNGDCIACYEKYGKRVAGSVEHSVQHNGRLYLFPSENEQAVFEADPTSFENSDLAINGECIVCLAKMSKHVPGSPDHTVINNGIRYLFPSAAEADAFAESPQKYISKVEMMQKTGMNASDTGVRLVGRSGCAGCEFGVTPISAPDELGLAVVGEDGSVTVVEGAHEKYPQIYKDRFQGKQLAVEGKVVKTEGKVTWIEPSSLTVVN